MSNKNDRWSTLSMSDRADLIRLYAAQGITDLKQMHKHYNGIPYRDFNTSEYDYFGASPDMEPKEEGQHWGSRNLYTAQLLKREDHPTRDLMLEGEKQAGYNVVRSWDGLEYSIPKEVNNYVEDYNSFGDDGDTEQTLSGKPTLEEFIQSKVDSTRNAALEKSYTRVKGIEIPYEFGEYEKNSVQRTLEYEEPYAAKFTYGPYTKNEEENIKTINYRLGRYYQAKKELEDNCKYGFNCIGTATDNYPKESRTDSNKDFEENFEKYGFQYVGMKNAKPGDIAKTPEHAMIYVGTDANGNPLFNYSDGGITEYNYKKDARYPAPYYGVYTYVGTPELIQQWTEEYNTNNSKKYGGKINSFSGEEDTPERFISKEEYLDKQRQAIIDKSIETSSTRILPTVPYVAKYANEEEWRRAMLDRLATLQSRIEYLEKNSTVDNDNENSLSYWKDLKKTIEEEFNKGFTNPLCAGASCIYTATDNYGKKYRVSSNRAFRSNPEKYGFTEIGLNEIKSGDIIQDFEWHNHEPYHAVTFIGYDDNNRAIFNYSKGGENEETIVKEGHYPFFWDNTTNVHLDGINNDKLRDNAAAYRFIGNKEDNDKWNSEYLKYRQNYENNWLDTAKQVIWNEAPKILVDNPYSKTILSGEEDTNNSTAVEFIKNTIQFPKRLVKGELMDLAQLFQHGFTGGKPFIIYDRIYLDDYYDISESFRGNPYITPAILTDTNAFMETE